MTLGIVVQHGDVSDSADGVLVMDAQGKIQIAYWRDLSVNFHKYARNIYKNSLPKEQDLKASLRSMVINFQKEIEGLRYSYRSRSGEIGSEYRYHLGLQKDESAILKVEDVAKFLFGKSDVSAQEYYFTHLILMEDTYNFRPDPHSYVSQHKFLLHSHNSSLNWKVAADWTRSGSEIFYSFIGKCQARIRRARGDTSHTVKSFNKNDGMFLDICQQYISTIRQMQRSPFSSVAVLILQSTGMYQHLEEFDRDAIIEFLNELNEPVDQEIYLTDLKQSMKALSIPQFRGSPAPSKELPLHQDTCAHIRRDFGNLAVYVIDDMDAEELDDGISVEYPDDGDPILHVHIANPTAFLPMDSEAYKYARQRSEKVYRATNSFAMLPESLFPQVNDIGLRGDSTTPQNVLTMSARVRQDGSLNDINVQCGIVRNVLTTSYAEVDKSFGAPMEAWTQDLPAPSLLHTYDWNSTAPNPAKRGISSLNAEAIDTLKEISSITKRHSEYRARYGGFAYETNRPDIVVSNSDSMKLSQTNIASSPSRRLVMNAAIIANSVAARFAKDNQIPVLYRTQFNYISPSSQSDYEDLLAHRFVDIQTGIQQLDVPLKYAFRFQKWIGRPDLVTRPDSHELLGLLAKDGGYTRVTSPLRRFGDLLGHYQIISYLLSGNTSQLAFTSLQLLSLGSETRLKETLYAKMKKAESYALLTKFMERFLRGEVVGMDPKQVFNAIIVSDERDAIPKAWVHAFGVFATFPARSAIPPAGESVLCRLVKMKHMSHSVLAQLV